MIRPAGLLVAAALLAGCATSGPHRAPDHRALPDLPAGDVAFEVFLLGNTADGGSDAVLRAVADEAVRAGEASAVVLLGDQTTAGLPDSSDAGFARAAAQIDRLAEPLRRVPGRVVVLPGDRDWAEGRRGLRRQARALQAALGDTVMAPVDQSGGPLQIELADGLRLIALDTGWWLRDPDDRPEGEAEGEDVRSPSDVALLLERVLAETDDDRRVVVGHHPLRSIGAYAGYRSAGRATATLGLAPLVDQTVGLGAQSLAAPRYRAFREAMDVVVGRVDGVVYASSHEQSLQAFDVHRSEVIGQTELISGTGGGAVRGVSAGRDAAFAAARPGYQRLVYYADGTLWAETVLVDGTARTVAHRMEVTGPDNARVDAEVPEQVPAASLPDAGGTVTQTAQADFENQGIADGGIRRFVWGKGYRDVWHTPATFEVMDLGTFGGGLTPVQAGGGLQSTTLRLQGGDGRLYEMRLVEKSGLAQVPPDLRTGVVGDVVLDFRSAMNPYGPLVSGPLAEAAGVLQPFFSYYYIPDDPRLGRYRETFGNRLALVNVRPDDDVSDVRGMRGAADVVSVGKLYEKLAEDQDHRVDARAYLRARLLDNVMADWDRHSDQWRWAAFEPGELDPSLTGDAATRGKVYLPVARDRDFAFHDVNGLLPALISRFGDPRLQSFDERITRVGFLNQSGFPQDRRFLARLSREDWEAEAAALRAALSDEAIDAGVAQLPEPIRALIGDRYRETLRARRDDLPRAAARFYEHLAEVVDVVGSDQRETFVAERHADGGLTVTVTDRDGAEIFRRRFVPRDTREVRLYGFGGRDRFEVTGGGRDRITLRIVGGAGRDTLVAAEHAIVHDTPDGLEMAPDAARRVSDRRADDGRVNLYDPREVVHGRRQLRPVVGYRPTDGVVLGASHTWLVPGFRLCPWGAVHTIRASVSTATGGVEGAYTGAMREALLGLDLDVDALASTPRYVRNFYGIGNATPDLDGEAARLDLAQARLAVGLGRDLGQGLRLVAGPTVRYVDPEAPTIGFAGNAGVDFSDDARLHAGGFARLTVSTADALVNAQQGVRLGVGGAVHAAPDGGTTYGRVGADGVLYVPVRLAPQLTLAVRGGVDHRIGTFPFWDAAVLGGEGAAGASSLGQSGILRGVRRERFAGRTAASASAELRAKLFNVTTPLAPFEVGALAFGDAGRVWSDDAEVCGFAGCAPVDLDAGEGLHVGAGGGLWLELLDRAVLNATVARSDDGTIFTFGVGFAY